MARRGVTRAAGAGALLVVLMYVASAAKPLPPPAQSAQIVQAANGFLATLDAAQKQKVLYAFDDEPQRVRWSNFPTGVVPRGGIPLRDMTAPQKIAAMHLLAVTLSRRGYERVQQMMEGDEVNKKTDTGPGGGGNRPPRGAGGPPPGAGAPPPGAGENRPPSRGPGGMGGALFGKELYYISFLGTPSETTPWMLQFGGHHLALNITIEGDRDILTPTLTGAQPALYTEAGKTVRPLGRESDKAVALLNGLTASQKKQAVLSYQLADLVLGPGEDGKKIEPEGLKASAMTGKQRAAMLDLIAEWAGMMNDHAASVRMAQLEADIGETWFAWSGPTTGTIGQNISAYYRIQGPHLVIEYAPQTTNGGDPALHVHTMYRDPTNDYGRGTVRP